MHIHGNAMSIQAANLYSAAQGERAAAAERAAEVRRKLLKSAAGVETSASPEETLFIGHWMDAGQSQVLNPAQDQDEYHSGSSGRDTTLG